MAMGMPYDLYWDGDIDAVKAYKKLDKLRQEQDNTKMWIQGLYFMEAVATVLSSGENRHTYPKKPYDLTGGDKDEEDDESTSEEESNRQFVMAKMQEWALRNNRVFEKRKAEEEAKKAGRAAEQSAQEPGNPENKEDRENISTEGGE